MYLWEPARAHLTDPLQGVAVSTPAGQACSHRTLGPSSLLLGSGDMAGQVQLGCWGKLSSGTSVWNPLTTALWAVKTWREMHWGTALGEESRLSANGRYQTFRFTPTEESPGDTEWYVHTCKYGTCSTTW